MIEATAEIVSPDYGTESPMPIRSDELTSETSQIGMLRISGEILRRFLYLPDNVKFRGFRSAEFSGSAGLHLECFVESPDMPVTRDGGPVEMVVAKYRSERIENGEYWKTSFDGWL